MTALRTPATHWFTLSITPEHKSHMTKCGSFEECDTCVNEEFDPFQCEDCEDASNYEPIEEYDEEEAMTLDEFRNLAWLDNS